MQFTSQFWSDADLDRALAYTDSSDVSEQVFSYYEDHETSFVTDYAATAPEEDFAETFMYFVLGKSAVAGEVTDKLRFFEQDAALNAVRSEILRNL